MNTSYDKQLILDFIEWCGERNVFLKQMLQWTPDYSSVDEDELVREYLENIESIIDENIYLREELLVAQKEVASLQLKLQGMFAVKLSEVAKVENRVRICNDMDSRWYAFRTSWSGPKFETELEATKWAEENGYHVK